MSQKRILIAGTEEKTKNYSNALAALGASCFFLEKEAGFDDSNSLWQTGKYPVNDFDGLLLPGGGDIDPALFGEPNQGSRSIDGTLDRIQLALLGDFVRSKKPVLGICKGMQLINVYFKGGIIQHLPTAGLHEYREADQVHSSKAAENSLLCRLYGVHFPVNSAHHQAIGRTGQGLSVVQWAPDGTPEALQHTSLPIAAVQWHPERMCFAHRRTDTPDGSLLLSSFLRGYAEDAGTAGNV